MAFDGLFWPSLAFLALVALDEFLKQKLAFVDKNLAQLTYFQHSDVKNKLRTRSVILNHCVLMYTTHLTVIVYQMYFNNWLCCTIMKV